MIIIALAAAMLQEPVAEPLWHAETGRRAEQLAVAGERVLVAERGGKVRCYALRTGELHWTSNLNHVSDWSVEGDRLVVGGGRDSECRVIDLATGKDVARRNLGDVCRTEHGLYQSAKKAVVRIDPLTLKESPFANLSALYPKPAAAAGGMSSGGDDPPRLWPSSRGVYAELAVDDREPGTVVKLVHLGRDGKVRWTHAFRGEFKRMSANILAEDGAGFDSVYDVDDLVVTVERSGNKLWLTILKASTGALGARLEMPDGALCSPGGRLFVARRDKAAYVLYETYDAKTRSLQFVDLKTGKMTLSMKLGASPEKPSLGFYAVHFSRDVLVGYDALGPREIVGYDVKTRRVAWTMKSNWPQAVAPSETHLVLRDDGGGLSRVALESGACEPVRLPGQVVIVLGATVITWRPGDQQAAAVDARDGTVLWTARLETRSPPSAAALVEGCAVVVGESGDVWAFKTPGSSKR